MADKGDVTRDGWVKWPETRKVVELGTISLLEELNDNAAQQKYIIFDPIPRVDGVPNMMKSGFSSKKFLVYSL